MIVNEGDDDGFGDFLSAVEEKPTTREDFWKVGQHPTGKVMTLHVGMTVRFHEQLCVDSSVSVIDKQYKLAITWYDMTLYDKLHVIFENISISDVLREIDQDYL